MEYRWGNTPVTLGNKIATYFVCVRVFCRISDSSIEHARLLAQTVGTDGKFDIGVSTFGTTSGILVHVEKVRPRSGARKTSS